MLASSGAVLGDGSSSAAAALWSPKRSRGDQPWMDERNRAGGAGRTLQIGRDDRSRIGMTSGCCVMSRLLEDPEYELRRRDDRLRTGRTGPHTHLTTTATAPETAGARHEAGLRGEWALRPSRSWPTVRPAPSLARCSSQRHTPTSWLDECSIASKSTHHGSAGSGTSD
jgi:hypothetical protein